MEIKDYFEEYKKSKVALCHMALQVYGTSIKTDEADRMHIKYNKDDVNFLNEIDVCSHEYNPMGERVWQVLNIEKPVITFEELWNYLELFANEPRKENINYYKEYLKISLLLVYLVLDYYSCTITKEEADNRKLNYDEVFDLEHNEVSVCHHYFEGAGEHAWRLFELEDDIIPVSQFEDKKYELKQKLLKLEKNGA